MLWFVYISLVKLCASHLTVYAAGTANRLIHATYFTKREAMGVV